MIRASLCSVALIAAACSAPPSAPPESPPDTPNNAPLVALRVTGSGQEGPFPIAQFSAEGTRDPDGDSLYYTWDFGDGTSLTTTYTRQNHAYLDDGRYTVVLTVTDTRAQTSATAEVYVDNATPMIT
ncbi:MAG TPA: PKD domain-containing protein, partial [Gemmatimonadales bacterium]|nr:PKD domain-containing protein [Gemmatimonadales bacterium]